MKTKAIQHYSDLFLMVFFLSLITIPLLFAVVTEDKKTSEAEKRNLATFPQTPKTLAQLLEYPREFEKYYDDHFGFREMMIYRYHRERGGRFGMSGTPVVIQGQGKWLFYSGNNLLEDFRGELKLSTDKLNDWKEQQQNRHRWLAERNIKYLSFSPPNKQTIYHEFYPLNIRMTKGTTRMEQLNEFLKGMAPPFYVDIHTVLKRSKPLTDFQLYHKTDTHWNHYGAYLSFQAVMGRVQEFYPEQKFVTNFPFRKKPRIGRGGDLATMLMINEEKSEEIPMLRRWKKCGRSLDFNHTLTGFGTGMHEIPRLKQCTRAQLKAIVFCDSFITNIEPFFSENFNQVLYLRKKYDQGIMNEVLKVFQPDIVIEERVERNYFR